MHIRNTHAREVSRSPSEVFAALEAVGTDDDTLWPAPSIPFVRTPGPLRVSETEERHGIIHAILVELEPGRSLVWRADQPFIKGAHGFQITPAGTGSRVEHVLDARIAWWFVPIWMFKVRAIHDRILEQLLERLQDASSRQRAQALRSCASRP